MKRTIDIALFEINSKDKEIVDKISELEREYNNKYLKLKEMRIGFDKKRSGLKQLRDVINKEVYSSTLRIFYDIF
jgi:hypothetical protein